jgi:V8-like Glu-specific endopeptidase
MIKSALVFSITFLSFAMAQAMPVGSQKELNQQALFFQAHAFSSADGYDFEGIVALSNCSGSLIQLEHGRDSDPALVLTNGHCFEGGFAEPGKYTYGVASSRSFNVLDSHAQVLGQVRANLVIYSTMTRTDITLYRLSETYADIKAKFNVRPLILANANPKASDSMEIISGFWKKGYSCSIENFVNQLKEADWTFVDSIRYSRPGCETIGGTSGSPILLKGTRTVIGVNNTGNEDGERCTMDNPCEVDANGNVTFEKGLSYGQQTYWIYTCLNSNNEVDLTVPGCLLPH